MDLDGRVEGGEFAGVGGEVGGGEVAEEDGEGTMSSELVGAGATDAEGGVCASYDDYFAFYALS